MNSHFYHEKHNHEEEKNALVPKTMYKEQLKKRKSSKYG